MKQFKYFNKWQGIWEYTDVIQTAQNNSYYSQKPYYKLIGDKWHVQDIPNQLNLSNTDTFHLHETKNR